MMRLTEGKLIALWNRLQAFRTVFSDLTRGDFENFAQYALSANTLWLEIWRGEETVGIITLDDLHRVVDAEAHLLFFDRVMTDKIPVCKATMRWIFETLPLNRITVTMPTRYFATVRLVVKGLGFRVEGKKRGAVLINRRWHDQYICGLLRSEAYQ